MGERVGEGEVEKHLLFHHFSQVLAVSMPRTSLSGKKVGLSILFIYLYLAALGLNCIMCNLGP